MTLRDRRFVDRLDENGQSTPTRGLHPGRKIPMGTDWRDKTIRYLITFSDGGSGRRFRDEPLEVGAELDDGGNRYRVVRLEQPPSPRR